MFLSYILIYNLVYLINCNFLDIPILRDSPFKKFSDINKTEVINKTYIDEDYDILSPLIRCSYLPYNFIWCLEPLDLNGNKTKFNEIGHGCHQWVRGKLTDILTTKIICHALKDIECSGNRTFFLENYPCVKFSGHYFLSTLICSILLGIMGIDRFILGHTGTAVGKALTLGGFGIWWIVDIILLIEGNLMPADDSSWMPYY